MYFMAYLAFGKALYGYFTCLVALFVVEMHTASSCGNFKASLTQVVLNNPI